MLNFLTDRRLRPRVDWQRMTVSQTPVVDPLATAAPLPAAVVDSPSQPVTSGGPLDSPAPAEPVDQPADNPVVPKRKSPLLIAGLAAILLLGLGGIGAAYLLQSPAAIETVTASRPQLADPGVPPPLPSFELATAPVANSSTAAVDSLALIAAAGQRLQARGIIGAGETAAPRDLIVRGGAVSDAAGLDLPNHQRWEFQFQPGTTIETYARQLDFFKVELGVLGGSQQVTYLSELSNPKPKSRVAPGNADHRLYLIWNRGPLREADEILVSRAGLKSEGKVLAHFCPSEFETELLRVEADKARENKISRIRRTVFAIEPAGVDSFRVIVTEQKGD